MHIFSQEWGAKARKVENCSVVGTHWALMEGTQQQQESEKKGGGGLIELLLGADNAKS